MAEKQTGKEIKILRSGNGTEYVNDAMEDFLRAEGIQHQKTIVYTPEQNGVAERSNRTLVERTRAMRVDANLDKKYWAEALKTVNYCKNISPTIAVQGRTPFEVWTGEKPDLEHLRVFGCRAFAHVCKEKRKKWDEKAEELMFVGYCSNSKGYRLINTTTHKITNSRNVHFIEHEMGFGADKMNSEFYNEQILFKV